jgi:hypothetical protein
VTGAAPRQPRVEAYIGASGSGKGVSIAARLRELRPARLLVWDPRAEYAQHVQQVATPAGAVRAMVAAGAGRYSIAVRPLVALPLEDQFSLVCRAAFASGDCVLVAEELSDVTSASRAPPAWRQCVTQGRHRGLHIIAAAQRPALIDKTLLGNATFIRCFTLRYDADRRAMAQALDVGQERIDALRTEELGGVVRIQYLERDFRVSGAQAVAGTIRLSR